MSASINRQGYLIMFAFLSHNKILKIVIHRDGTFNKQMLNQCEYEHARNHASEEDQSRVMTLSDAQIETLATRFRVSIHKNVCGRRLYMLCIRNYL